jgi:hypothetical protein
MKTPSTRRATVFILCAGVGVLATSAALAVPAAAATPKTAVSIKRFAATPASLPATGGSVRLQALTSGARVCVFTADATLKKLPKTKSCTDHGATLSVRLPVSRYAAARTYTFYLHAGKVNASTSVLVRAGASAPFIVTGLPATQTPAANGVITFSAAASGHPLPSSQWQFSTDAGNTWADVAANADVGGGASASYSFLANSSENGWEYRVVFSNSQGVVTTTADTLTLAATAPAPSTSTTPASTANWAGFVAANATFSAVNGSWTVPAVTCPATGNTYSSQWVGIDGYGGSTVEQDGIGAFCSAGTPVYFAWYEIWGDLAVDNGLAVIANNTTYPVHAGDAITATTAFANSTGLSRSPTAPKTGLTAKPPPRSRPLHHKALPSGLSNPRTCAQPLSLRVRPRTRSLILEPPLSQTRARPRPRAMSPPLSPLSRSRRCKSSPPRHHRC